MYDMKFLSSGTSTWDDAWAALQKSSGDLARARSQFESDQKSLQDFSDQVDIQVQKLNDDKAAFATEYSTKMAGLKVIGDAAVAAKNDAANTLQLAQEAQAKVDASQAALDASVAAAQPILAQADAVAKQKSDNAAAAALNSQQAAQNDKDANEIRTAKVALNNKEQELNARQAMIEAAEAKTGGN